METMQDDIEEEACGAGVSHSKLSDLHGCLPKPDRVITVEEMDAGIARGLAVDMERIIEV